MAAKVKRLREIRAQEDALAQPALAAAGPIVPPPLPAPPALGSVADAAVAGAEPSVSNPSAFDAVIEPPSLPQIEHKPAFDPPVAQQALGPLVLEANADGTGLPPTFVNRHINCQLREYQRDGVRFLWSRYRDGKGGILGDDMGRVVRDQSRSSRLASDPFLPLARPDLARQSRSSPSSRPSWASAASGRPTTTARSAVVTLSSPSAG